MSYVTNLYAGLSFNGKHGADGGFSPLSTAINFNTAVDFGHADSTNGIPSTTGILPLKSTQPSVHSKPTTPVSSKASPANRKKQKHRVVDERLVARERLTKFLEQFEEEKGEAEERERRGDASIDVQNLKKLLGPELPMDTSVELNERMKNILEKHLGKGLWEDIVASPLALPLDSTIVHCPERARLALPTTSSKLSSTLEGGLTPKAQKIASLTTTISVAEQVPDVHYLKQLAKFHMERGRAKEAISCYNQAAAILETKVVATPTQGTIFPYSTQAFKAAMTIQNMGLRRLARKGRASIKIQSAFRMYVVKRERLQWNLMRMIGAQVIQRRFRHHRKVLNRRAIHIQRVSVFLIKMEKPQYICR